MRKMKIAIISDTHGLLRPEVIRLIGTCDAVLHGGDINSRKVLDEIEQAKKKEAPFYVVRGNNDKEWAEDLPLYEEFTLDGVKFFMTHKKKDVPQDPGDNQIIIYGHSHKYAEESREGRLWLNPGSCGRRRFNQDITMAVLTLENGTWSVERIDIPHEARRGRAECLPGADTSSVDASGADASDADVRIPGEGEDLLKILEQILKRMEKGQQVAKIAADLKLDPGFAEQVCRIKVTHPGVTANGIMDKMEVNRTVTVK